MQHARTSRPRREANPPLTKSAFVAESSTELNHWSRLSPFPRSESSLAARCSMVGTIGEVTKLGAVLKILTEDLLEEIGIAGQE